MGYVTYSVRELQRHLGQALRKASSGQRILVTSRGSPVAVISKANGKVARESPLERKLRQLAAEGKIRLGSGKPIRPARALRGSGLTEQVLKDRR